MERSSRFVIITYLDSFPAFGGNKYMTREVVMKKWFFIFLSMVLTVALFSVASAQNGGMPSPFVKDGVSIEHKVSNGGILVKAMITVWLPTKAERVAFVRVVSAEIVDHYRRQGFDIISNKTESSGKHGEVRDTNVYTLQRVRRPSPKPDSPNKPRQGPTRAPRG